MGSRFAALDLPEFLRPWRELGVRFLYGFAPVGTPVSASGHVRERAAGTAPQQRRVDHEGAASTGRTARTGNLERARQQPSASLASRPVRPARNAFPLAVHEGELSPPWDTYLQRVCKSPRVVFTYWELHEDLGNSPSAARRAIWTRLLKHLAWPSGTVAFWPVCESVQDAVRARRDLFWRGVSEFAADTVVVFGRKAFMALFPDRPFTFRAFTVGGLRVIALPDPDLLVAEDRQAMGLVVRSLEPLRFG